ncbi:hypothetical protein [Mucilaginibacter ginkgonis]|uniref:Tetratricopeptide repeat protein n=1 Tax=Mucilaginibacter ginkgonis TaxID=2682091 RepID=A0A7T7JG30_9SPHI|nr:hypothetical protein [Mucilaginibacter ginkgonis]QQL49077.1 hypothetical protein GO620_012950 [Mucilaginibacter ginkgonis]
MKRYLAKPNFSQYERAILLFKVALQYKKSGDYFEAIKSFDLSENEILGLNFNEDVIYLLKDIYSERAICKTSINDISGADDDLKKSEDLLKAFHASIIT